MTAHQPSGGPRRVRRPRDKEELLDRLQQSDSPFTTIRDVLIFAAGVGYWRERSVPFERSGEAIRWDALTARSGTEPFINMLALSQSTDDVTILRDDRYGDRIRVFEEYANGGLEILDELITGSPKRVIDIVRDLVVEASMPRDERPSPIDLTGIDLNISGESRN